MVLHYIKEFILYFYGYSVFFYSMALLASYVLLLYMSYRYITKYRRWSDSYIKHMVKTNPYKPGISIVAAARHEENIVANVESLLRIDYPNLEVCIVHNDDADKKRKLAETKRKEADKKDEELKYLKMMIDAFQLVEVPHNNVRSIYAAQSKDGTYNERLFRSAKYPNLIVLDKVSAGTKADGINAGLNVISNPYFINTDVDCKLSEEAALQCIFPVLQDSSIIAVSGVMHISNGYIPKTKEQMDEEMQKEGRVKEPFIRHATLWPSGLFQDLEYKRSFYVGKMGWSQINAMNNVSGGYGLFNTEVVKAAGGYDAGSFAEDMDMVTRMVAYCCEQKRDYKIVQIPHGCCFTKGPRSIMDMKNQRIRWGRGLIQLMHNHHRLVLNPKYKRLGMIAFFNTFLFEFIAPVIEAIGFVTLIYLFVRHAININAFWIVFAAIYMFSMMLNIFVISYDYMIDHSYNWKSYLKLLIAAVLEPICYHPFVTLFSLRGYWAYIIGKKGQWVSIN